MEDYKEKENSQKEKTNKQISKNINLKYLFYLSFVHGINNFLKKKHNRKKHKGEPSRFKIVAPFLIGVTKICKYFILKNIKLCF